MGIGGVIGVQDDHDYGQNNGDSRYENKTQVQRIFLDFIDEPQDSERRAREGTYVSYSFGLPGKQVTSPRSNPSSFCCPPSVFPRLSFVFNTGQGCI